MKRHVIGFSLSELKCNKIVSTVFLGFDGRNANSFFRKFNAFTLENYLLN